MSVTKNAPLRYRLIDECLCRTKVKWTADKLLATVSEKLLDFTGKTISRSQLNQDIRALKEGGISGYDAPIEFDRATGSYRYSQEGFTIRNSPILVDDTDVLRQALAVLQQFQGLGLSEQLDELVGRVEKQVNLQGRAHPSPALHFERVEGYTGADKIRPLYQSIRQEQALEIHYRPFQSEQAQILLIHPYLLKEFNHRWFLIAFCEQGSCLRIYALDRIESITKSVKPYHSSHRPDPEAYFQHVVGPSVNEARQVEEVRLRFSKKRVPYVLTKPLHASQRVVGEEGDCVDVVIHVIPNRELVTLLLGFGSDLTVLSPDDLRNQLKLQHQSCMMNYASL